MVFSYKKKTNAKPCFVWQDYIDLRDRGSKALPCIKADYIPTLSRGEEILRYHDTSDEQIKEYDFDRLVLMQIYSALVL